MRAAIAGAPAALAGAPRALASALHSVGTLRAVVCAASFDICRVHIIANGTTIEASASATEDKIAEGRAWIERTGSPALTVAVAYGTADQCRAHRVAVHVGVPSIGGATATITCTASERTGAACSMSTAAAAWGVLDGDARVEALVHPSANGTAWTAKVHARAGVTSPFSWVGSLEARVATVSAAPNASGAVVTLATAANTTCIALQTSGGADDARLAVWRADGGVGVTMGMLSTDGSAALFGKAPELTAFELDVAGNGTPAVSAVGRPLRLTCTGSPHWACELSVWSADFFAAAAERGVRMCGSWPAIPTDASCNGRMWTDSLGVFFEGDHVDFSCEALLFDGESRNSTAVWVSECAGRAHGVGLDATCTSAGIPDAVVFYDPMLSVRLLANLSTVRVGLSGGSITLHSGVTLNGTVSMEVTIV